MERRSLKYLSLILFLTLTSLSVKAYDVQLYGFGVNDTIWQSDTIAVAVVIEGDTTVLIDPLTGQEYVLSEEESDNDLPYSFDDPTGTDLSNDGHPLFLEDPDNLVSDVEYDPETDSYTLSQTLGNTDYRSPEVMGFEDYWDYDSKKQMDNYWRERQKSDRFNNTGENNLLDLGIGSNGPFGSDFVDIKPQGTAELIFGVKVNNTENPAISVKQRRQTNFDFDMKIQMNVVGTIGDKLKLTTNYNTESNFDFENQMKLEYVGEEDEIIKKIEAGNVTLPLNSSLIQGSQSLFGLKTEMQFGRLTMTSVFSQQKGETKTIEVSGGAQTKEFEIRADRYEANKHFFLTHLFKDSYDEALSTLPFVSSQFQVQQIEVWTTNTNFGNVENVRNIVAFTDLGEVDETQVMDNTLSFNGVFPDNASNDLYASMESANARNFNNITNVMAGLNYVEGVNYNKIENARKLSPSEYSFHSSLGYLSLNRTLNSDEVLAVAIQYTYNGQVFQIGDLSTNTNDLSSDQTLFLKLLKSTQVNNTEIPLWELMMKNVYALGEYNVKGETFKLDVLYQDPKQGNFINFINEESVNPKRFIEIVNADQVNKQLDEKSDGIYDFIDGVTINASNGRIFFPVREPFGSHMRNVINNESIANNYAFDSLYSVSQNDAQISYPEKNRFFIKGSYESSSSSEISLNAMNVPQGSVIVTAGGVQLTENIDYTVDYMLGRVKILNEGILNSGTPIKISLESNSLFAIQSKTMLGTHFDYQVNKDFTVGGTILNLTERPITPKVNIGDEPISNTVVGINTNYRSEVPYITKLVDMIPLIDTKEKSTVTFSGEFAKLIPGSSKAIKENGGGVSYIDDFEGAQTSIDLKSQQSWILASTPQDPSDWPEGLLINNLAGGFNRARLSWYVIDPLFTRVNNLMPEHIKNDVGHRENNYVRSVLETEISPNKQAVNNTPVNLAILDLAMYPEERGPYNYDVDGTDGASATPYSMGVDSEGKLIDPASRWGGVMRKIETIDFEASNIEFIEMWMMDPFDEDYNEIHPDYDVENHTGGEFYIHLGNISEDILRDSRKSFENGMPTDTTTSLVDETAWGRVPNIPALVNAFDNDPISRPKQDVGLDGLTTTMEKTFFKQSYLDRLSALYGTNSLAYQEALSDPSNDDYVFFRGDIYDTEETQIQNRYSRYNGYEGNSATDEQSSQINADGYTTSATTLPNVEDINRDQTLSESESYYSYKINLKPNEMVVGQNHITQVLEAVVGTKTVKWYQFKIPIKSPNASVGTIQDFRSIRFMRMVMKGFEQPTICRMSRLELVRGEWRRYEFSLLGDGEYIPIDELDNTTFEVSAVNIEDNSAKTPVPYVLPPGVTREINVGSTNSSKLNEQSLVVKTCDLRDGDARAVFKNVDMDMRSYGRIKMYTHAEAASPIQSEIQNGEVTAFMRLGSDFDQNYYEYEIPLTLTPWGTSSTDPATIWPEDNMFDVEFEKLTKAKTLRPSAFPATGVFSYNEEVLGKSHKISVKGTPNLSSVRVIMMGIRNPQDPNGEEKCVEVWFNELRLSDFYEHGGWAATASVTSKLADFGQISLSGFMSTPGWGSIEKKVSERSRETVQQFDGTASLELGKFLPEKSGVKIPVYASYSKGLTKPEFNPLDPDVVFSEDAIYDSLKDMSMMLNERKSLNFSNVKKVRTNTKRKPQVYDVENLDFTYSYNQIYRRDINTLFNTTKNYRAAVNYNYNNKPQNVRPFRKTPLLKTIQRKRIENYAASETEMKVEIQELRKISPSSEELTAKELELKDLRERKRNFQKWSNKALRSPWLRPIKDFNFYYLPSKISVRTDLNRMYNESKVRNTSDNVILLDTNFNKNFNFNRIYDVKFDLAKGLKMNLQANNQARIDEPDGAIDSDWERDSIRYNINNLGRTTNYHQTFNLNYTIPINKFPITNWITSSARYSANYDWKGAPLSIDSLGNTIQNSNSIQLSGQANFVNFYNKIGYLKNINKKYQKKRRNTKAQKDGGKDSKSKPSPKGDKEEEEEDDQKYLAKIMEQSFRTLMMLKNASLTYNQTNGTYLPGYMPRTTMLGNDLNQMAPGLGFVFGHQEDMRDFQNRVWENQWLTQDTSIVYILPYAKTYKETYNARATIEPLPKFRIELTANRTYAVNKSEQFRADGDGSFDILSPKNNGNFSSTIITWGTAWEKMSEENNYASATFDKFLNYRNDVAKNLANNNEINNDNLIDSTGFPTGFGAEHQDVLILSFLSAYTNQKSTAFLTPFLKLPKPNWRVTYNGLSEIPQLKKHLQSVQVSHAYRSSFSIGSFINNLNYDYEQLQNNFQTGSQVLSENSINVVTITEQFSPLIKVDMKWKNKLITKVEVKKDRNLSLSLNNNRMTEIRGSELVIGTGYIFKGVELPIKLMGKKQKLKSDLDVRADLSVRDNLTVTRQLDGVTQATGGTKMVTLKTSADYKVSERLIIRAFFDRVLTDPVISTSYRNSNSNGGISVRFNLAQ